MSALGKLVGVIHLEQSRAGAFDPEMMHLVSRVAETVGLAMANARLMKTMEGQAMTDALTGLRNARFFDPYLEQELQAAERDREATSVIMLDLDHFKAFNDAYGHPAGDEALRTFARVLSATIRSSDVAARYGGEEFIVAVRHAGWTSARCRGEDPARGRTDGRRARAGPIRPDHRVARRRLDRSPRLGHEGTGRDRRRGAVSGQGIPVAIGSRSPRQPMS